MSDMPGVKSATECIATITEYLSAGGLFNPEMMEHDKVRDLLMDCRKALQHPQFTKIFNAGRRKGMTDDIATVNKWIDSCKCVGATPSLPFEMLRDEIKTARDNIK